MDIDEWFSNDKVIEKSRKPYAHFDLRTNLLKARKYITNPDKVAHHGFYPFIKFNINYPRYRKNNTILKTKKRPICYSAHIDRCIYQYYSFLINQKYNLHLKQEKIDQVPVAYRTDLHINNVDIFKDIIEFIRNCGSCYVMIGDFTDFFDNINHQYLKSQLCDLLQVKRLPPDYYAVFKSVTKYDYWKLDDLLNLNKPDVKDLKDLNTKARVLPKKVYKANRSHIKHNDLKVGIPQGSAISACLANVYMLSVDKKISDFVTKRRGIYKRYSDDFVVVLPQTVDSQRNIEKIIEFFNTLKKENLMELQSEKTQVFELKANGILTNIGHHFQPRLNEDKKTINFLGFSFDGKEVTIRAKTISKYYYRMHHKAIGIAHRYDKRHGFQGSDKLYRLYSERGKHGRGNFFTYVDRVKESFPDDPIDRYTKNHMVKIRRTLKKHQRHSNE